MERSLLAVVLEELDMTQGELHRRSGLSRQTIYDAYHGRPCSVPTWLKISRALNVPLIRLNPDAAIELNGVSPF